MKKNSINDVKRDKFSPFSDVVMSGRIYVSTGGAPQNFRERMSERAESELAISLLPTVSAEPSLYTVATPPLSTEEQSRPVASDTGSTAKLPIDEADINLSAPVDIKPLPFEGSEISELVESFEGFLSVFAEAVSEIGDIVSGEAVEMSEDVSVMLGEEAEQSISGLSPEAADSTEAEIFTTEPLDTAVTEEKTDDGEYVGDIQLTFSDLEQSDDESPKVVFHDRADMFSRTSLLIGEDALDRLAELRVAIVGLGGVGGAAAEALCRAGVGNILLIDGDNISVSNINRQIIADCTDVGVSKAKRWHSRLYSINPHCDITWRHEFLREENFEVLTDYAPDIVIDAIDTIKSKVFLIDYCIKNGIQIISSMGTGGRLDPTQIRAGDIADTSGSGCRLARVVRRELRRLGVESVPVVYSLEQPMTVTVSDEHGRHPPGSSPFVPPVAGFAMAQMAVKWAIKPTVW